MAAPKPGAARLVNRAWGFVAEWVPLHLALEQFASHPPALQDGLLLEWYRDAGTSDRLDPPAIRRLAAEYRDSRARGEAA